MRVFPCQVVDLMSVPDLIATAESIQHASVYLAKVSPSGSAFSVVIRSFIDAILAYL